MYSGDFLTMSHCDILYEIHSQKNPFKTLSWIVDFAVTKSPVIDFQTNFFAQSCSGELVRFSLFWEFRIFQMHGRIQRIIKILLMRKERNSGTKGKQIGMSNDG